MKKRKSVNIRYHLGYTAMKSAIVRRKWLQKRKVIMGLKVAKNGGGKQS